MGPIGIIQMIAEAAPAPDSAFFMQLVLSIALIASVAGNIVQTFRAGRTQKRDVTLVSNVATKEEFDRHIELNRLDHERLHARISSGDQRLQEELKIVGRELSGVKASNELQTQHLLRVESKIDRAIERGHDS